MGIEIGDDDGISIGVVEKAIKRRFVVLSSVSHELTGGRSML